MATLARTGLESEGRVAREFETFCEASYHRVLGLVLLSTRDQASAEDACQEAFAKAQRDWAHVSGLSRPESWVTKVALRHGVDAWRKRSREESIPASHMTMSDEVGRLWVKWGLDQLTPMQRRAVLLRYHSGMTDEEVALLLSRSKATIRTHLRLARARLRAILR